MQSSRKPLAVAYYRVSTARQGQSGLGLADQEARVAEFCTARNLQLDATFTEIESGKNDDRPKLTQALGMARKRGGILVVATLSRLGRRVSFVAGLMESGVPFAAADAPDDEPFILHIKAAFAEEEARKISTRTCAALAQAKLRGVKLGTNNLTDDGRRTAAAVIANRATAKRAQEAPEVLRLRADGMSLRKIAATVGLSVNTVQRIFADGYSPPRIKF